MKIILSLATAVLLVTSTVWANDKPTERAGAQAITDFGTTRHPVLSKGGMVSTQDRIAAQVGADILSRGGNAVDAAVATGFALAVTHPQAGNLGGGGFMLVYLREDRKTIAIDFREMAPASADRDMFLRDNGDVDNNIARNSRASAGVPGTVMGLLSALEEHGTMSRRQVMAPAIRLAKKGFVVSPALERGLKSAEKRFVKDQSSVEYFGDVRAGTVWKQTDLAKTLSLIAKRGAEGFYTGKTARLIAAEMQMGAGPAKGRITEEDLANYAIVTREPVRGTYRGYEVAAMSPPSSGGVHVIQMLNILEGYNLRADGHNSAAYLHKLIESMRRAYADRSKYLGDPDFVVVPVEDLMDKDYAARLRDGIDLSRASTSAEIRPGAELFPEPVNTTHFSVMDKDGNAVALTYTLNFSYGSGYSVDGAGFLLNNEMDDFSAKPGAPNGYGLIGGEANKIEPGKRPLSSMTPMFVIKDGEVILATGSPGGSTIITAVLQVALNVMEWEMNIAEATHRGRIHHQWLPDYLTIEPTINSDTIELLQEMGHMFPRTRTGEIDKTILGRVNSVGRAEDEFIAGAADPRGPKSAAIGAE